MINTIRFFRNGVGTDMTSQELADYVCVDKKVIANDMSPNIFRPKGSFNNGYIDTETGSYTLTLIFEVRKTTATATREMMYTVGNRLYNCSIFFESLALSTTKEYRCIQKSVSYEQLDPRLAFVTIEFACEIYDWYDTEVIITTMGNPYRLVIDSPKETDIFIRLTRSTGFVGNKVFTWLPDTVFNGKQEKCTIKSGTAGFDIDSPNKRIYQGSTIDADVLTLFSFPRGKKWCDFYLSELGAGNTIGFRFRKRY